MSPSIPTVPASSEVVATRRSARAAENFIRSSTGQEPGQTEQTNHWHGSGYTADYWLTFSVERRDNGDFDVVRVVQPLNQPERGAPAPEHLFGYDRDRFARNEARAVEKGLEPCTHCGRGVDEGFVTVVAAGGDVVLHPDEVTDEDMTDAGFMGAWVLGPSCAKKVPAAQRKKWAGWE